MQVGGIQEEVQKLIKTLWLAGLKNVTKTIKVDNVEKIQKDKFFGVECPFWKRKWENDDLAFQFVWTINRRLLSCSITLWCHWAKGGDEHEKRLSKTA